MADQPENFDTLALIHKYRQLSFDEPDNKDHHIKLGQLLMENKEYTQASYAFKKAESLDYSDNSILFQLALCYQLAGLKNRAITSFLDLLKREPNHVPSLFNLAKIYLVEGDLDAAHDLLTQAHQLDPKNGLVRKELFYLLLEQQKFHALYELTKRAIGEPEASSEDWHHYALALSKEGQYEEARLAYERAVQFAEVSAALVGNYAVCLEHLKEYDAAKDVYQQSLDKDPTNPDLWFNLGEFLLKRGATEEAKKAFQKALAYNNEDREAALGLAMCTLETNPQESLKYFRLAESLELRTFELFLLGSKLFLKLGKFEEALDYSKKAQLKAPDHKENNTALGLTYLKLGQINEAWDSLKRIHPLEEKDADLWLKIAQHLRNGSWFEQELSCLEKLGQLQNPPLYLWQRSLVIALEKGLWDNAWGFLQKIAGRCLIEPKQKLAIFLGSSKSHNQLEGLLFSLVPAFFSFQYEFFKLQRALKGQEAAEAFEKEPMANGNFLLSHGLFLWMVFLQRQGKKEAAESLQKWLLSHNFFPELAQKHLFRLYSSLGAYAELAAFADKGLTTGRKSAGLYALLAAGQIGLLQLKEAAESLAKARQEEENNLWVQEVACRLALAENNQPALAEAVQQFLALEPNSPEAAYFAALSLYQQKNLAKATEHLQAALKHHRSISELWELMGDIQLAENKPTSAKFHYLRAHALQPKKALLSKLQGIFQTTGENTKLAKIEKFLQQHPAWA